MITMIAFLLLLIAVGYAVQRNHIRQPFPPLRAFGSVPFDERVEADLWANARR